MDGLPTPTPSPQQPQGPMPGMRPVGSAFAQGGMTTRRALDGRGMAASGTAQIRGGMAGAQSDFGARNRAGLNNYMQQQNSRAQTAGVQPKKSLWSSFFGGASTAREREQTKAAEEQQLKAGKRTWLDRTLFGGQAQQAQTPGTYRERRAQNYNEYVQGIETGKRHQENILEYQKKMQSTKSSSLQRKYAREIEREQERLKDNQKDTQKSMLKYKYTK